MSSSKKGEAKDSGEGSVHCLGIHLNERKITNSGGRISPSLTAAGYCKESSGVFVRKRSKVRTISAQNGEYFGKKRQPSHCEGMSY
ncbi:hypothetical protein ATANTOWER_004364 [Ataeniobius toweri]|uniref:Uncharacterized protein n=1 Tax=Ataeniobius toweri TaxID=208326 RepID=A0ABU7A4D3_9TELE|nr:hypothetical protein [Ataeniobius toweri]